MSTVATVAGGEGGVRDRWTASDGDQARVERLEAEGGVGGGAVRREQPGTQEVRRVPGGGLPDRQRRGGRGLPASGKRPPGADGDALDGVGSAGDAVPARNVPE